VGVSEASRRPPSVFSPLTVVMMLLVGAFALSAFIVLATYAPDLQQGSNGGANALSNSGVGFSALPQLMRLQGRPVLVSRQPVRATGGRQSNASVLVLTPDDPRDAEAIEAMHFSGPMLIVLPKWSVVPHATRQGWVRRVEPGPAAAITRLLSAYGEGATLVRRSDTVRPVLSAGPVSIGRPAEVTNLQTLTGGGGWTPLVTDERGAIVLGRSAKHPSVYVLADPDLMNNWGMRDAGTAAAAEAMLDLVGVSDGAVVFDVSLNGFGGDRNVLRLMFDPPFLAVTLCLFAAALLMGIHAIARFGPAREAGRVFAFGKSVLADNTAALVRLAGREAMVAPRYAQLEKSLAARALAAPRDLSPEAVTDFLDRMSVQRQAADTLTGLTEAANAVTGRGDLLTIAQRLHRWRLEMTREHQ
jgi:hypothetical protein